MVGTVKKWLGIDLIERENLTLAKALKAHTDRLDKLEQDQKDNLAAIAEIEKRLTSAAAKLKIEPKPPRLNWRGVQAAIARENRKLEEE